MTSVPANLFSVQTSLQYLFAAQVANHLHHTLSSTLYSNSIANIYAGSFAGLSSVTTMFETHFKGARTHSCKNSLFSSNKITAVPATAFVGLLKLTKLFVVDDSCFTG